MLSDVFQFDRPVIGVVSLLPLPGSPAWGGRLEPVLARAEQEAAALASGGVHALLLDNGLDQPYPQGRVESVAAIAMALAARRVMQLTGLPLGIGVYQNDPETALAIAANVGASFIRVPVLAGAVLAENGLCEGQLRTLAEALSRWKVFPAPKIFADVSARHWIPETPRQAAQADHLVAVARFTSQTGLVDGLILNDDDLSLSAERLAALREATDLPLLLGSPPEELPPGLRLGVDGAFLPASAVRKASGPQPTADMMRVERWMTAWVASGEPSLVHIHPGRVQSAS